MPGEVDDRTDRLRHEDEPVGEPSRRAGREPLPEGRGEHRPGKLVVGHRGMADIRREEHLVGTLAGNHQIGVVEPTRPERAVDPRPVTTRSQGRSLPMREAESPRFAVVRGDERDCVGLLGERMEMGLEFLEIEFDVNGPRVSHHVEGVIAEVGDHRSVGAEERRRADRPFRRHDPVEDLRAALDGVPRQPRQSLAEVVERLPHSRAGEAAANGKEITEPAVHPLASGETLR